MLKTVNGLNLVRLLLVLAVVLSHSFTLGRYGMSPDLLGNTPGRWALAGLFTVSGYLVSSGAIGRGYGDYLARRVLRLWPAYVACLFAVVALFAPIVYGLSRGSLDGYLTAELGPLRFLSHNVLLELRQTTVSGTPDQFGWSGNLWTIFYTVLCYVIVGLILQIPASRVRLAAMALTFSASVLAYANVERLSPYLQDARVEQLLRFLPFFAGGALLYLLRSRIPTRWWAAATAAGLTVGIVALFPAWGLELAAPLMGYALLVLANAVPSTAYLRRNDFALGFFLYSYAVQKLLTFFGVNTWLGDVWLFFLASVLATAPFAVASWYLVERPVLSRLRRRVPVRGGPEQQTA